MMSLMAWRWQKKQLGLIKSDYWTDIGYEYAGPVIYGYAHWVAAEALALGIEKLLFVARDGYTLQKMFDTFDTGIKTSYVYAPRALNELCAKDAELMANYRNYLGKIVGADEETGIVDTLTHGRMSAQTLIQNASGVSATGFYWSITFNTPQKTAYKNREFLQNERQQQRDIEIHTKRWDFMEFLMTAPEYPIKSVTPDGRPVYFDNPSPWEKNLKDIYPHVSAGALDFANDVKNIFGGADMFWNPRTLVRHVNNFCDNPTKADRREMAILLHAYDAMHSEYFPIFSVKIGWRNALLHPRKSLRLAKSALWRTPMQALAIVLASPIKVRMRGLRIVRILLFPKLKAPHLSFALKLTNRWYYQIEIGSEKND
jgi:predicted HAD superfamily hydrolase